MRSLVTPEEMVAADQAAIESGTSVEVLMERAGRAVARTAIRMLGGRYGKKVVVVCGKGNNGGDGYAAARVLRREGVSVRCMSVVDPQELRGAALHHYERAKRLGVDVRDFTPKGLETDLVVDAILGTGSKGAVDRASAIGTAVEAIWELKFGEVMVQTTDGAEAGPPAVPVPLILAVDVPSGLDPASGSAEGIAVPADVTLSLAADKVGVFLGPPKYVGEIETVDIGIRAEGHVFVLERSLVRAMLPTRKPAAHKRSAGTLAVFAGSDAMTGAAALVVRGAMRAGCGYVRVACTPKVAEVVRELCPEALVQVVTQEGHLGSDAIDIFAEALASSTAVVVGPGLGQGQAQKELVERLLSELQMPIIVDADGLNVLGTAVDVLARGREVTITPHPGEMARLLGTDVQKVQANRLDTSRALAETTGATVLLKGYRTVICKERRGIGVTWVNPTGGPELATAGTGDVLSGVIGAFVAAGDTEGAAAGAYVHGLAGALAGERIGQGGLVAWDVAEAIPEAMDLIAEEPG
jgi:hydroxyethylthiazole kinase-like uncharacterized protein yjeF